MTKEYEYLNTVLDEALENGNLITVVIETSKLNVSYDIVVDDYGINKNNYEVIIEGENSTLEIHGSYNMSIYDNEFIFTDPTTTITLIS